MNSQTVIIEQCKKANRYGVHCFLNDQYDVAATHFGCALRNARELISMFENQQTTAKASNGPMIHSSDIIMPISPPLVVSEEEEGSSQEEQGIYKLPLLINDYAMINNRDAAVELSLAIMFNIALSCHLYGLSTDDDDDAKRQKDFLGRAMSLYEATYTLLSQLHQQESSSEEGRSCSLMNENISTELTMAIINNLGQIHMMLGNTETASKCFTQLLSTMVFLQQFYRNGNDDSSEDNSNNNESNMMMDTDNDDSNTINNNNKTRSCWKSCCNNEIFIQSVSHLILKDNVAPAA